MRAAIAAVLFLTFGTSARAACEGGEAVEDWLRALREASPPRALELAYTLDAPARPCQVEILAAALGDANPAVRKYAARLLGDAEPSQPAVAALVPLLRDRERAVREHAALALLKQGAVAVPALIAQLRTVDVGFENPNSWAGDNGEVFGLPRMSIRVSDYAALALIGIGEPAARAVTAAAWSDDENQRAAANVILTRLGPEALPALRSALPDAATDSRRLWAAKRILELSPGDPASCSAIGTLIANGAPDVQADAIRAAAHCPPLAPVLASLLTSPAAPQKKAAVEAYANALASPRKDIADAYWTALRTGPPSSIVELLREDDMTRWPGAIPLVRQILTSPDPNERQAAATLIGYGHEAAEPAVADLVKLLKDTDAEVRGAAIRALERLGPIARRSETALIGALRPEPGRPRRRALDGDLTSAVALALARVATPQTALDALLPMLSQRPAADDVVEAIGTLGASAAPAIPHLIEIVRSTAAETSNNDLYPYFNALEAIGPPAIPALIEAARTAPNPSVRYSALGRAWSIDRSDERVRAATRAALRDPDADVRVWAVNAFAPPLLPADAELLGEVLLGESDAEVRSAIFERLRKAGKEALPAARALYRLARGGQREAALTLFIVRPAAQQAAVARTVLSEPASIHTETSWSSNQDVSMLLEAAPSIWPSVVPFLESDDPELIANVLEILERAPEISPDVLSPVQKHTRNADPAIRTSALRVITKLGPLAGGARDTVLASLLDPDPVVRVTAARAIEAIDDRIDVPAYDTAVNDEFAEKFFARQMKNLIEAVRPPAWIFTSATFAGLPAFPLPPPRWSAYKALEPALLGASGSTLGSVHQRLSNALDALGYDEQALFGVPGGFALATGLERIDAATGTAFPPPARWTRNRLPPTSLRDYLEALFLEKPGYFRLFVFVITPMVNLGEPVRDLTEEDAMNLLYSSGRMLPDEIGALPFAGRHCHVLVYSFEKRGARAATLLRPDPLGIARHITAAGILARLPQ